MPSCTIFYSIAYVVGRALWPLDRPPATPRHPQLAGMHGACQPRTLESHNFMQQRQQCIVPSLAQSLLISMHTSISYNCSLPYVFSNSFHPRISRHPFCMFGLVCFVLFCFVLFRFGRAVIGFLGGSSTRSKSNGARASWYQRWMSPL